MIRVSAVMLLLLLCGCEEKAKPVDDRSDSKPMNKQYKQGHIATH